jgi:hypothetical protein
MWRRGRQISWTEEEKRIEIDMQSLDDRQSRQALRGGAALDLKAHYQGDMDGLCGMYAIMHAFHLCGRDDTDIVFQTACNALARSRWPKVLWDGTTLGDMKKMIASVAQDVEIEDLTIRYPFQQRPPRTLEAYWDNLQNLFLDANARCAIVGFEKPAHWTVIRYEGGRVNFLDSTAGKQFVRKNISSFAVNKRTANKNSWIPDRGAVILFSSPN